MSFTVYSFDVPMLKISPDFLTFDAISNPSMTSLTKIKSRMSFGLFIYIFL